MHASRDSRAAAAAARARGTAQAQHHRCSLSCLRHLGGAAPLTLSGAGGAAPFLFGVGLTSCKTALADAHSQMHILRAALALRSQIKCAPHALRAACFAPLRDEFGLQCGRAAELQTHEEEQP